MNRILIVDDHPVVRAGLKQILSEEAPGTFALGEAADGPEALSEIRKNPYDVVLLDISMPRGGGLEVLKQIKAEKPGLPVLILSIYEEDQYAVRALRAGASGYLTKKSAPAELIVAVEKVLRGGKYVSSTLAERLASTLGVGVNEPPHENLSDREFQVFRLIAEGKTVAEIADRLMLSSKTVSTYRTRILEKMRKKSNAELMRYAMQHELVK